MKIIVIRKPQAALVASMVPTGDPSAINTISGPKCLHRTTASIAIENDSEIAVRAKILLAVKLITGRSDSNVPVSGAGYATVLVLGCIRMYIVKLLTWARSTIGIIVDPQVCLRAEANFPKTAAYGFLQYELPMRFEVSGCATVGETICTSLVMVRKVDGHRSAVGRGVDAVGYGTPRSSVGGTIYESSVVHWSCHCTFKAEDNSQCCIKHGGSR